MRKISVIEKLIITVSAVITLSGVLLAGLVIFNSIKGYRALDLPAFYSFDPYDIQYERKSDARVRCGMPYYMDVLLKRKVAG